MHIPFPQLSNRSFRLHHKHVGRLKLLGQHPLMVPVITFAVLLLVSGVAYLLLRSSDQPVPNAYVVILNYDHHVETVPSREPTVALLLKKLKITLNQGDVVEPSATAPINQEDFRINIYRAVPVEVIDGTQHTFAFSAATTPRSMATQAGVGTYAEDDLTVQPTTNFLASQSLGQQVIIDRATPVTVNLYGTLITTRTHAKTIAALVREKHVILAKDDQVTPALNTPLTANAQIIIARNGTKLESVTETIPAPQQIIQDDTLAFGTSAVRQQGSVGQQITTYQDNLVNGAVVSRTAIQTVVTQAAVTTILVQGTSLSGIKADMALAGIAASDYTYADYIISHESGWCPTKAQGEHTCPVQPDNQFTSGGYGLCQATPGSKMVSAGADWATNPITQLRWCAGYATGRYGSWAAAYNHWLNNHNW